MKNSALLVVDIQNDFCGGGALAVKDAEEIISVVNKLIEFFNKSKAFVIGTKDWHPINHKSFAANSGKEIGESGELNGLPQVFWPVHCVQDTFGSELHKDLYKIKNIIYKGQDPSVDSYSGFFDNGKIHKTELDDILKKNGISTLYIAGLATDYCVKFSVLDALSLGYEVYVVEDGVRGVNLNATDSLEAIEEMKKAGAKTVKSFELLQVKQS